MIGGPGTLADVGPYDPFLDEAGYVHLAARLDEGLVVHFDDLALAVRAFLTSASAIARLNNREWRKEEVLTTEARRARRRQRIKL
jgi:hypothetical protein